MAEPPHDPQGATSVIEYREPPFNRVWVSVDPSRPFRTKYGLDYKGRTVEVECHWDGLMESREFGLREIADIAMNKERFFSQMEWEHRGGGFV